MELLGVLLGELNHYLLDAAAVGVHFPGPGLMLMAAAAAFFTSLSGLCCCSLLLCEFLYPST